MKPNAEKVPSVTTEGIRKIKLIKSNERNPIRMPTPPALFYS